MKKEKVQIPNSAKFEVANVTICDPGTFETLLGPIPALKIEMKLVKKNFINKIMERIKYAKFFKK